MATTAAGVGDLGQRHDDGNKHCIDQIEQLTTHDTLLLQAFFSRLHERARMMAKLRQRRSYLSQQILPQCPPASGSRHDGVAGIAALDDERVRAFPDELSGRSDLDPQRRAALDARAHRIVLRQRGRGDPGNCNKHRQTCHRYAHGLSPG
jgi:hypothetical protein